MAIGALLPRAVAAQDPLGGLDGRVSPEVSRATASAAVSSFGAVIGVLMLLLRGGARPRGRYRAAARRHSASRPAEYRPVNCPLSERLGQAADLLRQPGVAAPARDVVEGAADALAAGLGGKDVRALVAASQAPYDPAFTLQVAATLTALGVPPTETVRLIEGMIQSHEAPGDLLGLPGQVQAGVAHGSTPSQAAAGLARAAGGTPPGRTPGWVPPGQANPHKPPPNPHKP